MNVIATIRKAPALLSEWRSLGRPVKPVAGLKPMVQDSSISLPLGYSVDPEDHAGKKVAIFFHAYHASETVKEMVAALSQMPIPADLYVTTDGALKRITLTENLKDTYSAGRWYVRSVLNRGRDIWPKLGAMRFEHSKYDFVLHIHSKHSPHKEQLKTWRTFLWDHLLSPHAVLAAMEIFDRCPDVGMVAAQHQQFIRNYVGWGGNKEMAEEFAQRMGVATPLPDRIDFPSGSMFWARTAALKPLLDLKLDADDFPEEAGQLDNTPAHAIERLFFVSCEKAGFKWMRVAVPKWHSVKSHIQVVSHPLVLSRFVETRAANILPRPE